MQIPPRIVTMLASGTEIVHALGCGVWLVGRSHYPLTSLSYLAR